MHTVSVSQILIVLSICPLHDRKKIGRHRKTFLKIEKINMKNESQTRKFD